MYNYTLNLAQNMITSLMLCFKSAFRIRFRMDLVFFADPDPKLKTRIRICPLTNQWDLNDVVAQVFDFPDRIRIFGRSGSGLRKKKFDPDPEKTRIRNPALNMLPPPPTHYSLSFNNPTPLPFLSLYTATLSSFSTTHPAPLCPPSPHPSQAPRLPCILLT